ncbi:TPA: hypothetical protein ACH3X1_005616 [Trebouxia sp. C0004]
MYATEYYDGFFGSTADEKRQLYKHVASYLDKEGAVGTSIPNYQDPKEHPGVFWSLMRQVAPQLSKLAKHLFQPKKKLAGNQYLGGRTRRSVTLDKESATAEATQAKAETERQFMDDSSDLLLDAGQVDVIIQEYQ